MNEIIYLEPDYDVAKVVLRIKEVASPALALVIPRGGTIAQSTVNLKIIKREAEKHGKNVSLVTADKISKNLASQVGISVYPSVNEAKTARIVEPEAANNPPVGGPDKAAEMVIDAKKPEESAGFKINRYNKEDEDEEPTPVEMAAEEAAALAAASTTIEEAEAAAVNEEITPPDNSPVSSPPKPIEEEFAKKEIYRGEALKENKVAEIRPSESHEFKRFESQPPNHESPPRKNISSRKKPLIIIAIIFVILALALTYIFAPSADATITLKTSDVTANLPVNIDKSATAIADDTKTIPATEVSLERDEPKDVTATGTKNVGTKAGGQITFYNYYDGTPQVVPVGSVLAAGDKQFTLNNDVSIPGATSAIVAGVVKTTPGTATGTITASNPGTDYNIGPSKFVVTNFTGGKHDLIYGQSSAALTGGTTKNLTIVSEDDINKAKAAMQAELLAKTTDELNAAADKENRKVVATSIQTQVEAFDTSKKSGDTADTFTATMKILVSALSFSNGDLNQLIINKINTDIGADSMIISPDKLNATYDVTAADFAKGTAQITAKYSTKVGKKYTVDVIRNLIKNQKYGTAQDNLNNLEGVDSATLFIHPALLNRGPLTKSRIKVKFGYQE